MLESGYDRVIHLVPSLLSGGGGVIINREIESEKERFAILPENKARQRFLEKIRMRDYSTSIAMTDGISRKRWISIFVYPETLSEILPIIKENASDTIFWICGDVA